LVSLIDDRNVAVYEDAGGNLSMEVPNNFTPEQEAQAREDLVSWDVDLMSSLESLMDDVAQVENLETELRNYNVTVQPRDFTNQIQRARVAYARFKSKVINLEEDATEEQ
jgi:hypothetical protein